MTLAQKKAEFTYSDYLTWSDQERWEIIDGQAYNMTPAPGYEHQRVSGRLLQHLNNALDAAASTGNDRRLALQNARHRSAPVFRPAWAISAAV